MVKLSIYRSVYVPSCPILWLLNTVYDQITRFWKEVTETSFLCSVAALSSLIQSLREKLEVESPLLHIERFQLSFRICFSFPLDASLGRYSRYVPLKGGPGDDLGYSGETTSLGCPWNTSGFPQRREAYVSFLRLLTFDLVLNKAKKTPRQWEV